MKKIFAVFVILLFVFGCLGPENPPVTPQKNTTNTTVANTTNTTIDIIITGQVNQSIGQNQTTQPQDNQTPGVVVTEANYTYAPGESFVIYFLSVAGAKTQGDAIFIKKGNFDMLIDGGPKGQNIVLPFLGKRSVDDIDVLVSTNADADRYGGLTDIFNAYKVEEFWWGGDKFNNDAYSSFIDFARSKSSFERIVYRDYTRSLNGFNITVLNPKKADRFSDSNNDAVVIRLVDRNFSILFTSGIQTGAQQDLVTTREQLLKVNVMEAPFYGAGQGTANILTWLLKVKPDHMVITGGADETLVGSRDPFKRNLLQYNVTWYATYSNGTIRVDSDGKTYAVGKMN